MILTATITLATWLALAGVVISLAAALATLRAVYWARKTVIESAAAAEAATKRHDDELVIQRIALLREVLSATGDLVDVAREESIQPRGRITVAGISTSTTRVPAMQIRLRALVKFLDAIGGPKLIGDLPAHGDGTAASNVTVWHDGIGLLNKIQSNVFDSSTLRFGDDAGTEETPTSVYGTPDRSSR